MLAELAAANAAFAVIKESLSNGGELYSIGQKLAGYFDATAEIEKKAAQGTAMMIELYEKWLAPLGFTLNTPRNHNQRGGHISLVHPDAEKIAVALRQFANVIPDYRVPNSIRVAISPLATSYVEVFDGFQRLRDLVSSRQYEKVSTGSSRVT